MARRFAWFALVMSALALGASTARADEGQGKHHGKMREACKADVEKFCKDAKGDRDAMRKCMQSHEKDLSDGCKKAREEMKNHPPNSGKSG
jgi:hypothetical protein